MEADQARSLADVRDLIEWLVRIAELRDLGVLDDAEFTRLKSGLVGSIDDAVCKQRAAATQTGAH